MNVADLQDKTLARLLRLRAQQDGGRTLLVFEGRSYSYAEALALSEQLADGLTAAGVQPGQHVALMMDNRPEVLWLNFALALLGAIAVPVNTASRGDLLAYYVRQSDAVALVIDAGYLERFAAVQAQCPLLQTIVVHGAADAASAPVQLAGRLVGWNRLTEAPAREPSAEPTYRDTLHILFSSGTTGAAKGSMVSNASAIFGAEKHVEVNRIERDDVLYTCLPLFHGNAWNCTVLPALAAGATAALSRRFSASNFWREINQTGATHVSLLSAMINILWLRDPTPEERSHRLRTCLVVPTPEFAADFEQRYGVTIASLYALSDFGLATMLAPDAPRSKLRSAGRPLPEVSVAVLDENDLPLPPGTTGQICLRNNLPWFARQGYYKMPDAWAGAIRNLWFHTGDLGWLDEDGYLYFAGRNKELIRRRGENISALQVEHVLKRHPAVADAAVYAVRAEFLEDEVMASVVCRDGASLDCAELVEFCAPQMAYFMVPRFVEILPELPTTPTGKVEKYKLQEAAQPRLAAVWDREKSGITLEK